MREEESFRSYLKRSGRKQAAIDQVVAYMQEFNEFFSQHNSSKSLDDVKVADIVEFVTIFESTPKANAKKHLWALIYWFDFLDKVDIVKVARDMREERIKRTPFRLEHFMGVNQDHINRLKRKGIDNVKQMLEAGCTPAHRKELAKETGIPINSIIELVKLSDLSRVGALRSVRARLYHDAGVDTPQKITEWDPKELREMFLEYVEKTGFEGIAPLLKEVQNAVKEAKLLKPVVEY